ncbi:hypothetical protein ACS0TY_024766 [Phlomoides rotata]
MDSALCSSLSLKLLFSDSTFLLPIMDSAGDANFRTPVDPPTFASNFLPTQEAMYTADEFLTRTKLLRVVKPTTTVDEEGESVHVANEQKNMGAERNSRRALGDIGNVVTSRGVDGKPLHQPVTRGFGAKLLANAASAEEDKNLLAENANGALARPEKPAQKKAAVEPKAEEIMDTSPDSEEFVQTVKLKAKTRVKSRKKAPTLTSALTARSKAACGVSNKPKVQTVDIDAADANNNLAVVEYVGDIYKYYKSAENEGRTHDYMESQPDINVKFRSVLIDWLVQVHHRFELSPETLYLTVNIVDRYLASNTTSLKELQLVGISAMLIASKYEEIWAPEVNDLVCISDRTYSNQQVLVMEKQILGALEWNLTVPTLYVFLVRFIKASMIGLDVENMVYFLAELGMTNYSSTIKYSPSMIAASAVYLARCTLNQAPFWNERLKSHTGFNESQLTECAKLLVRFHSTAGDNAEGIYRKYSSSERGRVALLPPAQSLDIDAWAFEAFLRRGI